MNYETLAAIMGEIKALIASSEERTQRMISENDAKNQRMIAENEARNHNAIAEITARMDKESAVISEAINSIKDRITDMNARSHWIEKIATTIFALIGAGIGIAAVIIAGVQVYLAVKGGN